MPPSPWLSARITSIRYLTLTTITSDQKISERTPRTLAWSTPRVWVRESNASWRA